jgi:hypothetical protein
MSSYRLPNVGRLREAQERATQLSALPGNVQNREATLLVQCRKRSVLCRVFDVRGGLLFVPAGRTRQTAPRVNARSDVIWQRPNPYWLDPAHDEEVRARCRCCADPWVFRTADMLDFIRRGRRAMRLPLR